MAERPAINASLALTDWLVVEETLPVPELIQSWDLGAGESSVLTWELIAFWSVLVIAAPKLRSLMDAIAESQPDEIYNL